MIHVDMRKDWSISQMAREIVTFFTVEKWAKIFLESQVDLDPKYQRIASENFWEMF